MYLFQFLSTVHAKVANSNPTLTVLVRYNQAFGMILKTSTTNCYKTLKKKYSIEVSTD